MSDERMAAIAEREKAATAGPWVAELTGFDIVTPPDEPGHIRVIVRGKVEDHEWQEFRDVEDGFTISTPEDREFIAHAREDIPWLMERVRESGEQLESLREEVKAVLELMDGVAEQWGDEAVFRRCRDRLRKAVEE